MKREESNQQYSAKGKDRKRGKEGRLSRMKR
jgi:hypothetical protein